MYDISVTFAVFKLEISRSVSFLQEWNMDDISVTFAVFKYSRSVIVSKLERFLKKLFNDVGAYVLKLLSKTISLMVTFPKALRISATLL